ncbi:MAG: hypothetical protein WDZ85_01665 [Candidatus Paceibacterota bacterium]
MLEDFFYCSGKEGPSLGIILSLLISTISIFILFILILFISLVVRNKQNKAVVIISKILLILGILIFILMNYMWVRNTPTLEEYRIQREESRQFSEQQREEYLKSDEYKELQEESFKKSCESEKERKLENPNVLLPLGCE